MIFTQLSFYVTAVIIVLSAAAFIIFHKMVGNRIYRFMLLLFVIWLGIFSNFISGEFWPVTEQITITALNEAGDGRGVSVALKEIRTEKSTELTFVQGWWPYDSYHDYYYWVPEGDINHQDGMTRSVSFNAEVGDERKLVFSGSPWCGKVRVEYGGIAKVCDTYSAAEFSDIAVDISSDAATLQSAATSRLIRFASVYLILASALFAILLFVVRKNSLSKLKRYNFLFSQLIKRDFTLKYKRTVLGMIWSVISPLLNLLIMWLVFNQLLGSNVPHFVIYLFAGQLVFAYFNDATTLGMSSLVDNAGIFTKVNVPKYLFLFSRNVSSLINFGITFLIFFLFVLFEKLPITSQYLMLVYPIICMIVFNVGMGLILSALYMFFRDMQYLWGIFTQLLMWTSAIFYTIDSFPLTVQNIFLCNPIYVYISYFRAIVLNGVIPTPALHLLAAGYALAAFAVGSWLYKKYNHDFLYYV